LGKPRWSEIVPNPVSFMREQWVKEGVIFFYTFLFLFSFVLCIPFPFLCLILYPARLVFLLFFPARAALGALSTCDASANRVACGSRCQRQKPMLKQELASIIVPAVCSLIPTRDFSQDRLEDGDTQSCPVIIFGLCETTKAFFFNSLHLEF
jgi:hypothetical protein